jgi:hypothetical protein
MYAIVANVKSDRILRTGAKVWILRCNGDAECPVVSGLSKGGGMVAKKYTHYKRLTNFRAAWVPLHLRERVVWMWPDKARAQAVADGLGALWCGVRYFNRDGSTMLQDGITVTQAFDAILLQPIPPTTP